eukprot:5500841-Amphidinium_carterae.1
MGYGAPKVKKGKTPESVNPGISHSVLCRRSCNKNGIPKYPKTLRNQGFLIPEQAASERVSF